MTQCLTDLTQIYHAQLSGAVQNASRSEKELSRGNRRAAALFHALARGQQIHADKARAALEGMGAMPEYAALPGEAERSEVLEGLSAMVMTAAREGQPLVEALLLQILKASMSHDAALRTKDGPAERYHVCLVCGFVATDTPPERCPVCRAQAAQFEAVN